MKISNSKNGQTIIEAVVALALIIVVFTAITVAIITSVSNSEFARSQALASKYAQSAMETLRYLRNNPPTSGLTFDNYAAAASPNSAYCMDPNGVLGDNNGNAGSTAGPNCTKVYSFSNSSFIREVKFNTDPVGSGCSGGTRATVSVFWSSGKCSGATILSRYCHKSSLVSCFSKPSSSGGSL